MELLGEVEEHLRALSVEARKSRQLSGVKEAAERGTLKLRGLKTEFAGHLRASRKAEEQGLPKPPPFSFQSQDLLQPFLLACNYSDVGPKLTLLALGSIQHLINRDALHPADGPNVMRVLAIQAQTSSSEVHLRVLQSSLLLLSSPSCAMTEELLSQALLMCFSLSQAKGDNKTVRNAATATVRQIISMLFDRVQQVARGSKAKAAEATAALNAFLAEEAAELAGAGGSGGLQRRESEALAAAGIPPSSPTDFDGLPSAAAPAPGGGAAAAAGGGGLGGVSLSSPEERERTRKTLEQDVENAAAVVESAGLSGVGRCAYLVFQDLCVLSRGEQVSESVWESVNQ